MERGKTLESSQDQEEGGGTTEPVINDKSMSHEIEGETDKESDFVDDVENEKRPRLENSEGRGGGTDSFQEFVANSEKDIESWSEKALRNKLILRQIFSHLPTNLILRSCSLVNKTWNFEAREFIRDHRKCTAVKPQKLSVCSFLFNLQQLTTNIRQRGRVIFLNSLRIRDSYFGVKCGGASGVYSSREMNLPDEFKINYLEIISGSSVQCRLHQPFQTLLRHGGKHMKKLKIDQLHLLKPVLDTKNPINFAQLKEFNITAVTVRNHNKKARAQQKKYVRQLIKSAPKLKNIQVENTAAMTLIPKSLSALVISLDDFEFRLSTNEDINLLCKFSENCTKLKHLTIYQPVTTELMENSDEEDEDSDRYEDVPVDANQHRKFDTALERTLQKCHDGLELLSIKGAYHFDQLSFPPLSSLLKFRIKKRFPGKLEELWNIVASLDYESVMPRLREVGIVICSEFWSNGEQDTLEDSDVHSEWPPEVDEDDELYSSRTVRTLTLELQVGKINMFPLQTVFPHITVLKLNSSNKIQYGLDIVPFQEIWTCWPQLKKLEINGLGTADYGNVDAEFCGISKAEAKWLRKQTTKFLKEVHIVPIKPCILTMLKLRKLEICVYRDGDSWGSYSRVEEVKSLTKVTRIIAFDRMPQVKFVLPGMHSMLCSCSCEYKNCNVSSGEDFSEEEAE